MIALTVTHAFGPYAIGQDITDPDAVEAILAGTNAKHVVRVTRPDPEPTPAPADDKASGKTAPSTTKRG